MHESKYKVKGREKKLKRKILSLLFMAMLFGGSAVPILGAESVVPLENGQTEGIQQIESQITSNEVVIDLSQPFDYSNPDYRVLGSGEIHRHNPGAHYTIKNTVQTECYIFVGSGNNYNDSPGDYEITLENANIAPWQWNMSPITIGQGSSLILNLIGYNTISADNNWVNTRPLIDVPTGTSLIVNGPGSLKAFSTVSSFSGAGIGYDSSGSFGDITINSGTVTVDVTGTRSVALGGTGSGKLSYWCSSKCCGNRCK